VIRFSGCLVIYPVLDMIVDPRLYTYKCTYICIYIHIY